MSIFAPKRINSIESTYYNNLPSSVKLQLEALKSLDIYTKRHIEEVPKYVYQICEELKISGERLDFLVISAYLHDVGKIFIPPRVLQKNGKLTEEEYEIMKTHSVKGYEVCMAIDEIRKYATTVRAHHESMDGSGYPDGLIGDRMSYEANLIKVADVYSALSSKRQYKDPFTTKQIFEIMYGDVSKNRMKGEIVYALLISIIKNRIEEKKEIKKNIKVWKNELQYNTYAIEYLNKCRRKGMNAYEALDSIKQADIMYAIGNINMDNIENANELYKLLNDNINKLNEDVGRIKVVDNDIDELKNYAKRIVKGML